MTSRPRIYISAAHKSSGKTILSIGLSAALAQRGMDVRPFKKGPDFIDPMWLARASGHPCYNLDFNTQSVDEIKSLFVAKSVGDGISIIEGNKGLYDGVDVKGSDANAALVRHLAAPVILVLDVHGITRGVAPLVLGYQAFDERVQIKGVILNKVGGSRMERKLRSVLEYYTDVQILGAVGRDDTLGVRERHLGLTPPDEVGEVDRIIDRLKSVVLDSIDLDAVVSIANAAPPMSNDQASVVSVRGAKPVRIGVARDAAFGFYYADDLEALVHHGAELVYFNTLSDQHLPEVDGLFIGGGFPETQMAELSANSSLRREIASAARSGMPIYAECGGLMYLTRSISWGDERFEMVGVIEADTIMHKRPQGRGLVVLEETERHPWRLHGDVGSEPKRIAAHEFHYAALVNVDTDFDYAYHVRRGIGIDSTYDGIIWKNVLASFSHLRNTSQLSWARDFVAFVHAHRQRALIEL